MKSEDTPATREARGPVCRITRQPPPTGQAPKDKSRRGCHPAFWLITPITKEKRFHLRRQISPVCWIHRTEALLIEQHGLSRHPLLPTGLRYVRQHPLAQLARPRGEVQCFGLVSQHNACHRLIQLPVSICCSRNRTGPASPPSKGSPGLYQSRPVLCIRCVNLFGALAGCGVIASSKCVKL